jgi:hypothetical protein
MTQRALDKPNQRVVEYCQVSNRIGKINRRHYGFGGFPSYDRIYYSADSQLPKSPSFSTELRYNCYLRDPREVVYCLDVQLRQPPVRIGAHTQYSDRLRS